MVIPFAVREFEYTPTRWADLPASERPTFRLRTLRYSERSRIERAVVSRDRRNSISVEMEPLDTARRVLDCGLLGAERFGNFSVERTRDGRLTDAVMDAIGPIAIELANAIEAHSAIDNTDEKNS